MQREGLVPFLSVHLSQIFGSTALDRCWQVPHSGLSYHSEPGGGSAYLAHGASVPEGRGGPQTSDRDAGPGDQQEGRGGWEGCSEGMTFKQDPKDEKEPAVNALDL